MGLPPACASVARPLAESATGSVVSAGVALDCESSSPIDSTTSQTASAISAAIASKWPDAHAKIQSRQERPLPVPAPSGVGAQGTSPQGWTSADAHPGPEGR